MPRPVRKHPAAELIRQQATALPEGGSAEEAEVRALAHRVADLLDGLAESLAHWLELGWNSATVRARVPFQPTVALERSRPAGAGPAAERVAAAQARPGWRRAIPYLRAPLQAGTAAAITCPLADAINGQRFSWGLVGVLITLFGTNTTHERLRKLVHRVVGTAVGAVIGIALLRLIGPEHTGWTPAVIVGGLTIGSWGLQRQYAYRVVGLVVALVQMYGLTTPYGGMDRLPAQRLVDNALGCAAALPPTGRRCRRKPSSRTCAPSHRARYPRGIGPTHPVLDRPGAPAVESGRGGRWRTRSGRGREPPPGVADDGPPRHRLRPEAHRETVKGTCERHIRDRRRPARAVLPLRGRAEGGPEP
ncbi:hypothetical protein Shyhy02_23750 [Streptomyces hygroscopicus subsp. hygroscopicus]|nr:hypothetical protein Shyhy02_23750 [Streptomyces hygroscopicus subsp. hygroscopicus]